MHLQTYLPAVMLALSASAVAGSVAPTPTTFATAARNLEPRQVVTVSQDNPPKHSPIWGPVVSKNDVLLSRSTLSNWFTFLEMECEGFKWEGDYGLRKAPDCVFHHTGRMKQMCDVIERPDHPLCMKEYVELYAPKQFKWKTGGDDEVPDDVVPVGDEPVGTPPADGGEDA
ncbi:hypothetical protein D6C78_00008 [Aureobasidium pullulans]|uniref:Uncharacterized protein n=1 Tax=Aureobasidium pullulans TaxID=5580 RepID=A0A4T0C8B8_AURPU|nr:hypothetical protein D6C78_00008 [Aureobasidium pullulans]